jgi:hypothetical protein
MFTEAALMPVTTPVVGLTVPNNPAPVIHVPPEGLLDNVTSAPTHTEAGPVIAAGSGSTVTVLTLWQPVFG